VGFILSSFAAELGMERALFSDANTDYENVLNELREFLNFL